MDIAFDPSFDHNDFFYVSYTINKGSGVSFLDSTALYWPPFIHRRREEHSKRVAAWARRFRAEFTEPTEHAKLSPFDC